MVVKIAPIIPANILPIIKIYELTTHESDKAIIPIIEIYIITIYFL